jgi:hypothetical protein
VPKKKHVVRNCRARLRPKMVSIKKRIAARYEAEVEKLQRIIVQRDQQLVTAGEALRDADKGRSLKSHLKGWWANR